MDRRRLIDEFRAYLREHNLPVTPQRVAVAEVLLLRDRHFSADEVKQALAEQGTAIGTATVYRALEVLVRSGLVVERDRRMRRLCNCRWIAGLYVSRLSIQGTSAGRSSWVTRLAC